MKRIKISILILFVLVLFIEMNADQINDLFSDIKLRSIGPASMSGRISAIDAVNKNSNIIYLGTATGGVWKSINNGITWKPVFDKQPVASIGDIKIFQKNPNIIWVGTGEGNVRNSAGVGRGIYRSIDAGKSWKCMGLINTERIVRVVIHPDNSDIVYAAAMGKLWGKNRERGIYKTVDGGKSWKKILYVNDSTGACELVISPDNPNKLIAAMWEHQRQPWFFNSGGKGSGLYISSDAGTKWVKLNDKIAKGNLGRIGVAFSKNKSNIVYAIVEATVNALYKSNDGGYSWKLINNKPGIHGRPFYYSKIQVNPVNENLVYMLQTWFRKSIDGGKNFVNITSGFRQLHSDFHALWIADDGEKMIIGNDGGVGISNDRGKNWRFIRNLPLSQFYHVSVDNQIPYNVYGGLQDNGSWAANNTTLTDQGICNYHWRMVGFGDGFDTEPDLENPGSGYGMSQGGNLYYFNLQTGVSRDGIRPPEGEVKNRFSWNAGLAINKFDFSTVYFGSQFLFKTRDKGLNWEKISPDLTKNQKDYQNQKESGGLTKDVTGAENYGTIITITPSPLNRELIWVGTDDGNIQLTKDEGKTWTLVSKKLTNGKRGNPPAGALIPMIEASHFDEATAYVAFEDHQRSNWETYIFKTEDYGKTWENIKTDSIDGFVHVIKEDPDHKGHLFLGTEFGLFFSYNDGKRWVKLEGNFPTVAVKDLAIHKTEKDLVVGTHGRGIYILDDITPLGEFSETVKNKEFHFFSMITAFQYLRSWTPAFISPSDADFLGENEKYGAKINFYIKNFDKTKNQNKIEVLDSKGKSIRTLKPEFKKGFNRVLWDLRQKAFKIPGYQRKKINFDYPGSLVLPGIYTIKITFNKNVFTQNVTVKSDPRLKINSETLKKNFIIANKTGRWLENLNTIIEKLKTSKEKISTVLELLNDKEFKKVVETVFKKVDELKYRIISKPNKIQGIYRGSRTIASEISSVNRSLSVFSATHNQRINFSKVQKKYKKLVADYKDLIRNDLQKIILECEKRLKEKSSSTNNPIFDKTFYEIE